MARLSMKKALQIYNGWGDQQTHTACFSLVQKDRVYPFERSACHHRARHPDFGSYDAIVTTTYANYNNGTFTYIGAINQKFYVKWWTDFLLSVLNDTKSMYHCLQPYVDVLRDKKGYPLAWVIDTESTDHVILSSFFVLTRRVKERDVPIICKTIADAYPDLNPMKVLHIAELTQRECLRTKNSEDIDKLKVIVTPNNYLGNISGLKITGGHTPCTLFHPWMHVHMEERKGVTITSALKGSIGATFDYLEKNSREGWKNHESTNKFLSFLTGQKGWKIVEPMWHSPRTNSQEKEILVKEFIPQFVEYIEEVTKL